MRSLRKLVGLLLLVPLAGVVVPADPADAANRAAASFSFTGDANLGSFPCTTNCPGDFLGSVSGEASGDSNGNPWTLTLAQNKVQAWFSYSDAFLHCAAGTAVGSITMSAQQGAAIGTYGAGPLPSPVTGFSLSANFVWFREGTTAVLTLTDVYLDLSVTPLGGTTVSRRVVDAGIGDAVANFVPVPDPTKPPPDCATFTSRPPVTGKIAGTGVIADAA